MRPTNRLVSLLTVAWLMLFVAAGGLGTPPACADEKPRPKDTVLGARAFDINIIDPSAGTGYHLWANIDTLMEPLMRMEPVGPKMGPGAAQSWKISEDGLTWTFTLRKGILFHNGDRMTAEDVKFGAERCMRPEMNNVTGGTLKRMLDRIEVVDDLTVRFVTNKPWPDLPASLINGAVPVPKGHVEKVGDEEFSKHPVSAGPFKVVEYVPLQHIKYEGFEDHYARVPYVKTVILKTIPELTTRLAMLKTGEADIIDAVSPALIPQVEQIPGCKVISGPTTIAVNIACFDAMEAGSPQSDKRVRQALNYAIDRETIIKQLFAGKGVPLGSWLAKTVHGSDPDLPSFPYDPERAKKLLAEAGYPNGFETEVYTYESSSCPRLPELTEVVTGYWAKVGVKAKLTMMELGTYYGRWGKHQLDNLGILSMAMSPFAHPVRMHNYTGATHSYFSNAELDKVLDEQESEMNPQERQLLFNRMMGILREECSHIYVINPYFNLAAGPRVKQWRVVDGLPYIAGLYTLKLEP